MAFSRSVTAEYSRPASVALPGSTRPVPPRSELRTPDSVTTPRSVVLARVAGAVASVAGTAGLVSLASFRFTTTEMFGLKPGAAPVPLRTRNVCVCVGVGGRLALLNARPLAHSPVQVVADVAIGRRSRSRDERYLQGRAWLVACRAGWLHKQQRV